MKGIWCDRIMTCEKDWVFQIYDGRKEFGVTELWWMKVIWCDRVMTDERDLV